MKTRYSHKITQLRRYENPIQNPESSPEGLKLPHYTLLSKITLLLALLPLLIYYVNCRTSAEKYTRLQEEQRLDRFTVKDLDPLDTKSNLKHFLSSNEIRLDLYKPYIENLKGGYVGVGTDQNFTLMAYARSDYAWLIDFDPMAVYLNRIHIYLIHISPTFDDYASLWEKKNYKSTLGLIMNRFSEFPDLPKYKRAWDLAYQSEAMVKRFKLFKYMTRKYNFTSFHDNQDDYQYLRQMVAQKRIQPVLGNLLGPSTMRGIAQSATSLKIPIRVIYLSNAEDYFSYSDEFRQNILAFPIDDKGLLLRTVQKKHMINREPECNCYTEDRFHYNIQKMTNFHVWLSQEKRFNNLLMLSHRTHIKQGLSVMDKNPPKKYMKKQPLPIITEGNP